MLKLLWTGGFPFTTLHNVSLSPLLYTWHRMTFWSLWTTATPGTELVINSSFILPQTYLEFITTWPDSFELTLWWSILFILPLPHSAIPPIKFSFLQKCRARETWWWAWEPLWRQAYHGDFYWQFCLTQAADMVHLKQHSATHPLQCTFLEKSRQNNTTQVWI